MPTYSVSEVQSEDTLPSYLHSELPLREVCLPLLGLLQNSRRVLGGKTTADSAGLLGAEIERKVLLVLVEEAELSTLLGVDDGENASDGLAKIVAEHRAWSVMHSPNFHIPPPSVGIPITVVNVHLGKLGARGDNLLDTELAQLGLELTELLDELVAVLGPQLASLNLS